MKKCSMILIGLGLNLSLLMPIHAQTPKPSLERPLGTGTINWKQQLIKVTGAGAPPSTGSVAQKRLMAKRAAIADAYRQLAEAVNGVQVRAETTVNNYVVESDVIRLQVKAVIRGARPKSPARYMSDGSVEIDLEMPIFGGNSLAQAMNMGQILEQQSKYTYADMDLKYAWIQPALSMVAQYTSAQASSIYSGLIIDASGLGAEPALAPFIVGAATRLHPDRSIGIDPQMVVQKGVLHYVEDLDEAKADIKRIGKNPLIIEAKAAIGNPTHTDILINKFSAKKIIKANKTGKFLEQLKVTLVI